MPPARRRPWRHPQWETPSGLVAALDRPYTRAAIPPVPVIAPGRSNRPRRRGDSRSTRGAASAAATPIGTLTNSTHRQAKPGAGGDGHGGARRGRPPRYRSYLGHEAPPRAGHGWLYAARCLISSLFRHAGVTAIGDPPRAVVGEQRRKAVPVAHHRRAGVPAAQRLDLEAVSDGLR